MSIKVGEDRNLASLSAAVGDAIATRAGLFRPRKRADGQTLDVGTPCDRAKEFRSLSLMEIGRKFLKVHGVEPDGMSRDEVVKALFSRMHFARLTGLAMGTSDFPYILANVLNKSLRQSYELARTTWQMWAKETTAPDFKQVSRVILSSAPALAAIAEGGEYTYGSMSEGREVYTLAKYGKALKFTREMMINDDLGAFNTILPRMGAKAKYLEDIVAYAILTANAVMADGVALFNAATHANDGEGAIDVASLNAAFTAMGTQTDLDGATIIENEPRYLIVPKALEITAATFIKSIYDPSTGVNNQYPNPFAGRLEVVACPHLDANSTTRWYLAADPAVVDTVDVCFLEGERQPVLEEDEDFDTDCRKYKVRHQIVAKAIDWRSLYRSTGVEATTA